MQCYPEIKMNSILLYSKLNPTNVILSERSQLQKNKFYFFKVHRGEKLKDVRSKSSLNDGLKNLSTNFLCFSL